jgi:phosphoglycerate kinase
MVMQLKDLSLKGKRVLIRVDFNVPMTKEGAISDDSRIRAALPTIQEVIKAGGRVILMSHLGRPKGVTSGCSLKPCAERLSELLGKPVQFVSDCIGETAEKAVAQMKDGDVVLLENLRFYEAEEHPDKDPEFAKKLAKLGDVYINDAFGTAHRAHSSTAVIAKYFPKASAAGFLMMKEVQALGASLLDPKRPFVAIIGGAKISTKLGVLKSLVHKADFLLIGGAMTFTFMKAVGLHVGDSPVEDDMVDEAIGVMQEAKELGKKTYFPLDLIVAQAFKDDAPSKVVDIQNGIPVGFQGMDIGPKTIQLWKPVLESAKTIFWNGPLGVFEFPNFAKGTQAIAQIVASCKQAFTVVGGGDSIAALEQAGLQSAVSHVSTGGGASLEFIEQGTLPGLEALEEAAKVK